MHVVQALDTCFMRDLACVVEAATGCRWLRSIEGSRIVHGTALKCAPAGRTRRFGRRMASDAEWQSTRATWPKHANVASHKDDRSACRPIAAHFNMDKPWSTVLIYHNGAACRMSGPSPQSTEDSVGKGGRHRRCRHRRHGGRDSGRKRIPHLLHTMRSAGPARNPSPPSRQLDPAN